VSAERVALTFDDGPATWTESILDLLSEHSARATFFVIGAAAARRSDVVRRMLAEGHEVGNHTWSHPWLARDCDGDRIRSELERTNALLADLMGRPPQRFRAPHYDVDERVLAIASALGLVHTRGDVTPPDWDERCTAPYITTFVVQQATAGVVIGLHDGVPPRKAKDGRTQQVTVDAVAAILPRLRDRGLECLTASDVLGPG
jgi:peptidoglycan/xylan/chitin deacetylase (PgdA/CDA1 family)